MVDRATTLGFTALVLTLCACDAAILAPFRPEPDDACRAAPPHVSDPHEDELRRATDAHHAEDQRIFWARSRVFYEDLIKRFTRYAETEEEAALRLAGYVNDAARARKLEEIYARRVKALERRP
jgi:hypothetical protein